MNHANNLLLTAFHALTKVFYRIILPLSLSSYAEVLKKMMHVGRPLFADEKILRYWYYT